MDGAPLRVLNGLKSMLAIRKQQPAFHPEAPQKGLSVHPALFVLERRGDSQTLMCLFNLSNETVEVERDAFVPSPEMHMRALYQQGDWKEEAGTLQCSPYAFSWFELSGD